MLQLDLVLNLTLLVALSIVSGFLERRWSRRTQVGLLLQGLLFGGVAVLGMLAPLNLRPGIFFDGRSILVSLCALYFGPWAVLVAVILTLFCRIWLGGAGLLMGSLVILSSATIGLLVRRRLKPDTTPPSALNLYLFGCAVHLVMVTLMLTLPRETIFDVFRNMGVPILVFYPLATVLAGKILSDNLAAEQNLQALRESEETYRALVAGLPDLVMRFTLDGRPLYVSDKVEQVLDLPASEFLGKTNWELGFSETQCNIWDEALQRVVATGEPYESEFHIEGKQGLKVFNWRFIPEFDEQGLVQSILSISRDITEQRKIEQAYKQLFNTMLNGFAVHELVYDEQGKPVDYRFLAVNPSFEQMTGLRAEAIIGKTVIEVLPNIEPQWIERYSQVALTGEPALFEDYSEDLEKHFEVTAFRPAPNQFACLVHDITKREQAEEERATLQAQLLQSQKLESVGRLAGGVAHDYNNMLSVILGYADLAKGRLAPGDPLGEDLQEIIGAAERSADITRQLLAFASKQTINPTLIDINELVDNMLKMLRRLIGENIELSWLPGVNLGPVQIDLSQFEQILANLCVNARDAITGVGKITIETTRVTLDTTDDAGHAESRSGDFVQLAVSDDGCGMDSETLGRVFEPFFTTKAKGRGTGLGLASVYGIVRQNNGFINIYSEPGQGTTFKIYLPCQVGEVTEVEEEGVLATPIGGAETVLLVEDEPAILKMTETMLEILGYRVLAASKPLEALHQAKEYAGDISLLLTDVIMPQMDGHELTKQLQVVCPALKILYMSGYTADVIAHRGALEPGVAFLQKPFSLRDLALKVRAVLEQN
jgi:PAS domain S-box-containing protein